MSKDIIRLRKGTRERLVMKQKKIESVFGKRLPLNKIIDLQVNQPLWEDELNRVLRKRKGRRI